MPIQVPVVWYEGVQGLEKRSRYGIATLLNEAFDGARDFEFLHQDTMSGAYNGAVVVLHGEHLRNVSFKVAADMSALPWALVVVIGDEASVFPTSWVMNQPNRVLWQQMPVPGFYNHAKRKLICGYPHDAQMHLANYDVMAVDRPLDWFYSGQVNHIRRRQCIEELQHLHGVGQVIQTPGFWQGLDRAVYYRRMAEAKIVPCPAGASTPDTLRVAEALEAGCVPIADGLHYRIGYPRGYWQYVFEEEPPFPIIEDWRTLQVVMDRQLADWPNNRNRCVEWWKNYKRKMVSWMQEDIFSLRGK